jgi:hypothetical protein
VVASLEHAVRFGFVAYTSGQGACPTLVDVPFALGNHAAIEAIYATLASKPPFKADTPTGAAVAAGNAALEAVAEPGPKVIVLATDGEPDNCAHPDPQCGQDESIAAVQAAWATGIATYVIGIGNEVGAKHLGDLANAGAGLAVAEPDAAFVNTCLNSGIAQKTAEYTSGTPGGAQAYQPADQAALEADLAAIIAGVRSCSFVLQAEVDPARAGECEVVLDQQPLAYEEDWRLNGPSDLEVVGDACDAIQSESQAIAIACPCDVALPR